MPLDLLAGAVYRGGMAAAHTETHTETRGLNHPRLLASTARNGWAWVAVAQAAWAVGDMGWPSLIYGFGASMAAAGAIMCHRQARAWRGVRVAPPVEVEQLRHELTVAHSYADELRAEASDLLADAYDVCRYALAGSPRWQELAHTLMAELRQEVQP